MAARRKSLFHETGLSETDGGILSDMPRRERPQSVRFRSKDEVHVVERLEDEDDIQELRFRGQRSEWSQQQSPLPTARYSMMYRLGSALLLLGALLSLLQSFGYIKHDAAMPIQGVSGGPVPIEAKVQKKSMISARDTSATSWCFRWAQQSAVVNGTLYLYGGELTTEPGQESGNWTNNFLSLDLTKTWNIASPTVKGLDAPDGPPEVALGYLWNSHDSLYLYGGEFSWKPAVSPVAFATWEYNIASGQWIEHSDPTTSSGLSAPDDGIPVQRAAEGAGVTVPSLGRGFYFGGHEDGYTTMGWEQWFPKVYLQSLLEFTFPGQTNPDVDSLKGGALAGPDGVYRNITEGGIQAEGGFTARADGVLVFVPGFGEQGILVALAGGTNTTFTLMNEIDIYDIATSSWYTQATSGSYPKVRVNPCSVVAAAPDGSSYNIYMFGGQNLIPYDQQIQYQDMWILTLPTFQWIEVPADGQSVPYGRSGATCNAWDAQMVMFGGYIGPEYTCEQNDVYVYDLSKCQWTTQFNSVSGSDASTNFLNQQSNQAYKNAASPGGLPGSYGYLVPDIVVKEIGGGAEGGATITKPVVAATGGPMKTGTPIIYSTTFTTTLPNGHTATVTGTAAGYTGPSSGGGGGTSKIAAIVVGVVCGLAFIVIIYLLFCLYLYRKQLALYKRHVDMTQAQARGEKPSAIPGLWTTDSRYDSDQTNHKFLTPGESASHAGSGPRSQGQSSSTPQGTGTTQSARRSSQGSSTEDLLTGHEPTFVGVMLHPRRSLKVVNRD